MENHYEVEVEINGDTYTVQFSSEELLEASFEPQLNVDIHRVSVWTGTHDQELNHYDLPADIREHLEEVARYQAERLLDET